MKFEVNLKPSALLIHVNNVKLGLDWYAKAFPESKAVYLENSDFTLLFGS